MNVRGPLPDEAAQYKLAVEIRLEEMRLKLFELYPNVLWGDVHKELTE